LGIQNDRRDDAALRRAAALAASSDWSCGEAARPSDTMKSRNTRNV
jgi:hypothetical protein